MKASELKTLLEHVLHDNGDIEVVVDDDDPESWCPIRRAMVVAMDADDYGPAFSDKPAREALALELF